MPGVSIADGGLSWVAAEPLAFTSADDGQSMVRRLQLALQPAYPARMSLETLFALAAQHAKTYRDAAGEAPPHGYAAMRKVFDAPTPEQDWEASEVIEELVALSTPGLRAMTGPRFFGWVIGASHPVGAANWLTSAWVYAGNHEASPAAAVEAVAAKWLLDLLELPHEASVGFATGVTVANFVCLAAARSEVLRLAGWDVVAHSPVMRVRRIEAHRPTLWPATDASCF
jgi:hypothetical protein